VWVVGAKRWRNPDHDLPGDFEAYRNVHYAAIRQMPSAPRPSTAAPGRVLCRSVLDQGRPAAHAHPSGDGPLEAIYKTRVAVERTFGRLKHEWALLPLRIAASTV
jgi:hypothetical protein